MSALKELMKIDQESRDFGFEWPHQEMILDYIVSECQEIREAIAQKESKERLQEEIGDLLHAAISLNRFSGFDIEETLEKVVRKFECRMASLKVITQKRGLKDLNGQSVEFMLGLWKEVKEEE